MDANLNLSSPYFPSFPREFIKELARMSATTLQLVTTKYEYDKAHTNNDGQWRWSNAFSASAKDSFEELSQLIKIHPHRSG